MPCLNLRSDPCEILMQSVFFPTVYFCLATVVYIYTCTCGPWRKSWIMVSADITGSSCGLILTLIYFNQKNQFLVSSVNKSTNHQRIKHILSGCCDLFWDDVWPQSRIYSLNLNQLTHVIQMHVDSKMTNQVLDSRGDKWFYFNRRGCRCLTLMPDKSCNEWVTWISANKSCAKRKIGRQHTSPAPLNRFFNYSSNWWREYIKPRNIKAVFNTGPVTQRV